MAKKNTITLQTGLLYHTRSPLKEQMYKYRWFYLMLLPVFIFVVVFYYLPNVRYCLFIHRVQAD